MEDWETLKQFGYTASRVHQLGIKAAMNELATKRIEENLYGELEAVLMYSKRNTKYGIKLEHQRLRAKKHYLAKTFDEIAIISMDVKAGTDDIVIIRFYKIENRTINRKKIHKITKKVTLIDDEILLFFANGGVHPQGEQ